GDPGQGFAGSTPPWCRPCEGSCDGARQHLADGHRTSNVTTRRQAVGPYFGLGPYLSPAWLPSVARKTMRMITPTSGMRPMRIHQPERPVSWRRRMVTPRLGRNTARL